MRHEVHDRVSLEVARRVAARLETQPELIEEARENLRRWIQRNSHVPGLVRGYQEWLAILERPVTEVQAILIQETDEGQRLRQNTPFVMMLPTEEIAAIRAAVFNDQRAA
jgi:hypothetical protein